jgi:SAM-dependent methyltransferase
MDAKEHWEDIYRTNEPDQVSWYRPHLDMSVNLVRRATRYPMARIIDVGGGEATLIDDLLTMGYKDVSLLDISPTALAVAKHRLGVNARRVTWLCGDVTKWDFPLHHYDIWHDRAVFHFLTEPDERAAYVAQVLRAVKLGGHVIVATFGPNAPTHCSGLPVMRYGPDALHDEFGDAFRLVEHDVELHRTPAGVLQQFVYCYCKVMPTGEPDTAR